jgi:hypothetical protein
VKVKMLLKIVGSRDGVAYPEVGATMELPDNEAAKLCDAGFAEPVVEDRSEKAVVKKRAEQRS